MTLIPVREGTNRDQRIDTATFKKCLLDIKFQIKKSNDSIYFDYSIKGKQGDADFEENIYVAEYFF